MRFVGPLILSMIIVIVAIIIGAAIARGSWQDFPEKDEFKEYVYGRKLFMLSCNDPDCHSEPNPKEYSVNYMRKLKESGKLCPKSDTDPVMPDELDNQLNMLSERGEDEEVERLTEEFEKNAPHAIHKYLIRTASLDEKTARAVRNANSGTAAKYVKFLHYEEGMKLVEEKKRPYIVELSEPFET
ncbi:MAG: hypothetical protein ACYS8W_14090 [Planctomycetota bacterium]|jgi:hypothetical protein